MSWYYILEACVVGEENVEELVVFSQMVKNSNFIRSMELSAHIAVDHEPTCIKKIVLTLRKIRVSGISLRDLLL